MDISFKFDPEIVIGADTLSVAGTICNRYTDKVMIAADSALDTALVNRLKDILEDSGVKAIVFDGIQDDSSVEMAENIVELSSAAHCAAIVGFGGLKTQLISRMAAIMAPMKISACDLLDGRIFQNKILPLVAIPTAGTDPFAFTEYFIAADPRNRLVKSIQSPSKLYAAMIVDSTLFQSFTGSSAAVSVLDGFSTAVEAYCSTRANFLSDAVLERALNFYAKLLKSGSGGMNADIFAQAAFLTSLGASASSPGAISALSFAVNARFPAVKQACAAALLPLVAERLAGARPEKMAKAASFLGNTKAASVADAAKGAADGIRRCMEALGVQPNLKEFNISLDKITAAAEAARGLEFVANSSWIVSAEDVFDILKQII
jgi:alcohol dehydrogenase class IV